MKKSGFLTYLIVVLVVFSTQLYAVETDEQMARRLAEELLKPGDAGVGSSQAQALSLYTKHGFRKNNPSSISKPNEKETFKELIQRQTCDCGKGLVDSEVFVDAAQVFDPGCPSHRTDITGDYHPITFYHGTSSEHFKYYAKNGIVDKGQGNLGEGYYLTTDPKSAYFYARMQAQDTDSDPMILLFRADPNLQVKGFKEEDKKKIFAKDKNLKLLQDTSSPDRYNQFVIPGNQDLTKLLLFNAVSVVGDVFGIR